MLQNMLGCSRVSWSASVGEVREYMKLVETASVTDCRKVLANVEDN